MYIILADTILSYEICNTVIHYNNSLIQSLTKCDQS